MKNKVCVVTCFHCEMETLDNPDKEKCLYLYKCYNCWEVVEVAKNEICYFKS